MNNSETGLHALVTGASAGIGEAYVRQLAGRCSRMMLVARREERLQALIASLPRSCEFIAVIADLSTLIGQTRVVEAIRQSAPLDLLINNAGFSTLGPFAQSTLDDEIDMLRVHQEATLALTRASLPAMCERGRGAVVNVSSIGGLVAMPGVAVYGGTKAFLVSFSRSLQAELRDSGVHVQCLCPGYTRTEIHSRDRFRGFDIDRVPEALWMDADTVVEESLADLLDPASGELLSVAQRDRWLLVPGEHNRDLVRRSLESLRQDV